MFARSIALWFAVFLFVGCPLSSRCQQPTQASSAIRVKVNLVLVPTRVNYADGRPVSDLERRDFELLENGLYQHVSLMAPVDAPVAVALVMDVSGSTQPYLTMLKKAATDFVARFGPVDRLALYTVGTEVIRVQGFTEERESIRRAIEKLSVNGRPDGSVVLKKSRSHAGTLLYDGLLAVQDEFRGENQRRVILAFTDAMDAGSVATIQTLRYFTLQGNTILYAVMPKAPERFPAFQQEQLARVLEEARKAAQSDGSYLPAESSAEKEWIVVMDLSAVRDAATLALFQQTARDFLEELRPRARVWLFDYRSRLEPLAFQRGDGRPADLRALTPQEAARLMSSSGNESSNPRFKKLKHLNLRGDKMLILTDVNQSGVRGVLKSLRVDARSLGILHPQELKDAQRRRDVVQLLVHHPLGPVVVLFERPNLNPNSDKELQELARDTGGEAFIIKDATELDEIYADIANYVRSSYTLGYYAKSAGEHRLEVKVPGRSVVVKSRRAVVVQ